MSVALDQSAPKGDDTKDQLLEKLHIARRALAERDEFYFRWITLTRALEERMTDIARNLQE